MGNNFRKASFKESVSEVPNKALVIANDFESPFSIGQLACNTYFVEQLSQEPKEDDTELFLLNLDTPRAIELTNVWLQWNRPTVNYWATFENWVKVQEYIGAIPELSIEQVDYDDCWIKLVISMDGGDSIHSKSFLYGLEVLRGVMKVQVPLEFEAGISEPSFRGYLVSRIIPFAKPFKRFLPPLLVIYIYKLLEKLR